MNYLGDIRLGDTVDVKFTTRKFTTGAPFTLAGTPSVAAYVGNSTTEITAGITLTVDFDSRTGLNNVRVVASSGNGFATATNVALVITAGTVDSVSVVGEVIAEFSIENRSPLMPTTAGRTLDVSSGGEAGLDWANIGSPTTAQNLSATNIDVDQVVASVSGAVGSVTARVTANVDQVDGAALDTHDAGSFPADVRLYGGTAGTFSGGRPEVNVSHAAGTAVQAASGRFQVDVELWNGTAVPAEHTAGYPIVTIKDGTGTGEINTNAGAIVLVDTLTTYTGNTPQTGDSFARIGAAGAGLTAVPWNAAWDAEVQSEVQDAIEANHLDHLFAVADPGGVVANSSFWAALVSKSATPAYASYVNTTDSLEALRDRGDAAWTTATGFSTLTQADVRTAVGLASANLDTQLTAIDDFLDTEVAAILAAVDTEVAAIKAKTDNLPASPAAVGSQMALSSSGLDLVLVESGISAGAGLTNDTGTQLTAINARQALASILSAVAAVLAGAATTNVTTKPGGKPAGNNRIDATVDSSGNRSVVNLKVPD